MDSPERNLTISAAEVQTDPLPITDKWGVDPPPMRDGPGSPLFNFLCSLSPIKPVKSVHVAQTFSEISFPPPAVFVSPRIDAQKDSRSIQRNQSISRVEEVETGLGSCLVNARTEGRRVFLNSTLRVQRFGGVRKNDSTQKEHLFASPCSSPSKLVEEYLAEPVEDKLNTEGFSRMPPNSSTYESKINSGESIYKDVDRVDNLVGCTFAKQEVVDLAVMSKLSEGGGSDEAEAGVMEKTTYNFQAAQGLNPSKASSTLHLASQSSGGDKKVLDFDQDASDFEFLLSEEAGKLRPHACLDDWHTQTSSALSELSVEQVEGYIASLRQVVNEEEQEKEVGLSIELAANFVADKSPVIDNLEAEPEAKGDQQGAAAYKANTPLQRGVRRRCLDFQVSEGQLKSKTGILSLRPMHANSSTRSEGVSSCDVEANVSLLVLRERASATFGATNSDSIQGLDACTQVCSREDGTASTKVTCANSSNLRLSRCLSLKNIDSQLVCATTRHSGTSPLPAGMLSGIGLHLNSLTGSSMQFSQTREIDGSGGAAASVKPANAFPGGTTCSRLQGSQAENTPNCFLPGNTGKHLYAGSTASFRQGLVVSLVEKTRMDGCEVRSESSDQVIISSKSTTCVQSVTLGIKQAEENVPSSGLEKRPSPLGQKRVLLPEFPHQRNLEGPEESSQSPRSPKKKRRSSSTAEKAGDGCKRCNCKKSKCLKLYCECFAAGVYCVDSCTCHDCFNKPEFEETVMETRQQIESRNPLAFAPKIIRAAETSPAKRQEDCHDTPASARHKRGCNCKKSHCLKKYCECYQAGVGCSDGCRCESCKNVYGMKEGAEDSEGKDLQVEAVEKEIAEEHIDTSDFCNKLTQGSQQQNNDLSPITPSFQYAGQNRTTIKLRPASKRRFPSDELHSPTFSLSSVKLSRSPSRLLRSCKGTQNSPPCASTEIPLPKVGSSPVSTPRILRFGQFSPRWEGLGDICTLTPLPQAPFRPTPASASVLDGADSSPSINGQHCYELSSSGTGSVRNSSKFTGFTSPMSQHQSSQSSVRCQTPVNTQGTPVTPMFASPACAMDNKSCYEESETVVHQFEGSVEEDGTPEFLKDLESGCSPVCLLNSSSPKHKRVSPPHHHALREASHRGLQSPGVRSGRKFILQSIPSVPPTPFPAVHEQSNGSRNCKAET